MRNTRLVLVTMTMILALHQSCGNLSKLASDKIVAAGIRNKQQTIDEAVKFSIGITYNTNLRSFASSGCKGQRDAEKD